MSGVPSPQRGEVWLSDFDPNFGHEQGGRRPVLMVSVDSFNSTYFVFRSTIGSSTCDGYCLEW
jgi:mRNA-degrading endonuclease toxin of MazEF toxin-antitoxin module